ncbi:MAG: restriction endonuclease subunit R, partial [Rhizobacter sp.]|nr:restriction endonuclease subunit R [Chlorobiales bacterium]
RTRVEVSSLNDGGWSLADVATKALLEKLKKSGTQLGEYVKGEIYYGIKTGLNEAFVIDAETKARLTGEDAKSADLIKPFLAGRDIKRYAPPESDKFLIFTRRGTDIKKYPAIEKHLLQFKAQLTPKPDTYKGSEWEGRKAGNYKWFEIQDAVDYYAEFEKKKIIYPNICKQPEFAFDVEGLYTNQKCFIISLEDKYLLGVLNSRVSFFLFQQILPKLRGDFYEPSYVYFKDFPIANATQAQRGEIEKLVERMLELKRKAAVSGGMEREQVEAFIKRTDKEIDAAVYGLYELTAEEIKVVEGGT